MAGACSGIGVIPQDAIETILTANTLPLEETARDLLQLREDTLACSDLKEARNSPTRPLARNKKNGENRIFQLSTVDSKVVGEDLRSDALCGNTCRW